MNGCVTCCCHEAVKQGREWIAAWEAAEHRKAVTRLHYFDTALPPVCGTTIARHVQRAVRGDQRLTKRWCERLVIDIREVNGTGRWMYERDEGRERGWQ